MAALIARLARQLAHAILTPRPRDVVPNIYTATGEDLDEIGDMMGIGWRGEHDRRYRERMLEELFG